MSTKQDPSLLGKCHHSSSEEIAKGKWIAIHKMHYTDPKGAPRVWEAVSRTTKCEGEADAVGIVATLKDEERGGKCVILVRQYRPPLKSYTIEFPAGLIDAGETAEQAAIREMEEETGYKVKVKKVYPATSLDGGIGNTTLKMVTCTVDAKCEQAPGEDEFIQVLVEPLATLEEKLNGFTQAGDVVDSRLYFWAVALGGVQ